MNDYNGFLKTKSGKGVKKAREDLEKIITYNERNLGGSDKEVNISTYEFVILFLNNGYKAIEDNETIIYDEKKGKPNKAQIQYRFEKEDNRIEIEKNAFEYAKYLINNHVLDGCKEVYDISNISENVKQDDMEKIYIDPDIDANKTEVIDNNQKSGMKKAGKSQADKDKKINNEQIDKNIKRNQVQNKSGDENNFENWLLKQIELYPENDSSKILKEIFEKEKGVYNSKTKEILVLIDNFDDALCKERLIEKLCSVNTANRKVFEHITGLELPITNLDLKKYFQFLTKFDFKDRKEYIPVSRNEYQIEEEFYIKSKKGFEKVIGYSYFVDGLNLFIRYSDTEVIISDIKTGVLLVKGTNEKDAKDKLRDAINKKSIKEIKEMLTKQDINPIYANVSKVNGGKNDNSDEIDDDKEYDNSDEIDDDEDDNEY